MKFYIVLIENIIGDVNIIMNGRRVLVIEQATNIKIKKVQNVPIVGNTINQEMN